MKREPHDICHCGDYRSQHDEEGCKVCRWSTAPWDGCMTFRFYRRANREERRHWGMHHGAPETIRIAEYQLKHFRPHKG